MSGARDEVEITSADNAYPQRGDLKVKLLGRGFAWLDTGTHDSLMEASQYIQKMEHCQGLKVACLEEISWSNSWIASERLKEQAGKLAETKYGEYLEQLLA